MEISGKRAYALLEKIGFTRIGGTAEELAAAKILMDEVRAMGAPEPALEPFEIPGGEVHEALLRVTAPYEREYAVRGYLGAQSTPPEGLELDFAYGEDLAEAVLPELRGKAVLTNGRVRSAEMEKLMRAGAAAVITMNGSLYDAPDERDIADRSLRERVLEKGNLPAFQLHVCDGFELVRDGACRVHMTLRTEAGTRTSHNVSVRLAGTDMPEEIISFGAHYDSVMYSKGVYDNGSGSVIIMELLRYFVAHPPRRTMVFNWFGSEEMGLLGSRAWTEAHADELERHRVMLNVDVAGPVLGRESLLVTGEESLQSYLMGLARGFGYPISEVRRDVASSDSSSFADKGVPALSFARGGATGAAFIHDRRDTLAFLSADSLERTSKYVLMYARELDGSAVFPAARTIPDDMRKKLDEYFSR